MGNHQKFKTAMPEIQINYMLTNLQTHSCIWKYERSPEIKIDKKQDFYSYEADQSLTRTNDSFPNPKQTYIVQSHFVSPYKKS